MYNVASSARYLMSTQHHTNKAKAKCANTRVCAHICTWLTLGILCWPKQAFYLSVNMSSLTIPAAVLVPTPETVILKNVHHLCHLREDENARALLLQSREKFVQRYHLATVGYNVSICGIRRTWTRGEGEGEKESH